RWALSVRRQRGTGSGSARGGGGAPAERTAVPVSQSRRCGTVRTRRATRAGVALEGTTTLRGAAVARRGRGRDPRLCRVTGHGAAAGVGGTGRGGPAFSRVVAGSGRQADRSDAFGRGLCAAVR